MESPDNQTAVHLSVRALAEAVHRSGGLGRPAYAGISASEGIRLHRLCFDYLREEYAAYQIQPEAALKGSISLDAFVLSLDGRCDAIAKSGHSIFLFEFKSFTGSPDRLPPEGEPVHWAQAYLYAYLYLAGHPDQEIMQVVLIYIHDNGTDRVQHVKTCCRSDIYLFAQDTARQYCIFASDILRNETVRLRSGLDLSFPYPDLREGQKSFMQAVIQATRTGQPVLVCAPTGIGKTMAALYPAVKAIANQLTDQVFYLTHMTSARLIAAQAMADMHHQGLLMKSIVLYAKEQLCLEPKLFCDTVHCPYAASYYIHIGSALQSLFSKSLVNRGDILSCAKKYQVCPFELSLDMAVYCDIVICDYNYAFDPRAHLIRFFNPEQTGHLLLVDEAHNLPDRSRNMYSAECHEKQLHELKDRLQALSPSLADDVAAVLILLDQVKEAMSKDLPALDLLSRKARAGTVIMAEQFRAMREQPDELLIRLSRFNTDCYLFLEKHPDFEGRPAVLKTYFQLLFFTRIAEEHFDSAYVTTFHLLPGHLCQVSLLCLDASEKLSASFLNKHPAVFFSATLSPMIYYQRLIVGHNHADEAEILQLPSPFPAENLLLMICSSLSTRYRNRQETVQAILALVNAAVRPKIGNYLVFVPSHAYLQMVQMVMRSQDHLSDIDLLFQDRTMNEAKRQQFIKRFDHYGERTLLAFAVIGGVFSEGIDLSGEKLCGVVVIGVGLPQICPEREIMKQYFGQLMSYGYPFAYLFPGFNKVQQAAGRVIRSETDRGFVLLIDDRYETEIYQSLFPVEWQPVSVDEPESVTDRLHSFWGK